MDYGYDIPVVLFVFKRLETVQMIMAQIRKVRPKILYIFSDGAREDVEGEAEKVQEVSEYVRNAVDWDTDLRLLFSEDNKGCDRSIREGLNLVFSEQKMAVIFEDDAVPVKVFFPYCEELLQKYENDERIQYIAGFNALGEDNGVITNDYTFGHTVPMSGAFATWADRWNNCDFDVSDWPKNKSDKRFDKVFYSREMRFAFNSALDDIYSHKTTAWDYMFMHDMLNKDRIAVVPKSNLATSYGYMEGAFHPQKKNEAKKLFPLMLGNEIELSFPLSGDEVVANKEYDYLRQRKMLEVNGNYFQRQLYHIYLAVKNTAYRLLPQILWDAIKHCVT